MECLVDVDCDENKLFEILNDFENLPRYLPRQLQAVEILEEHNNYTLVQVTIFFKTLIKKEISQQVKIFKTNEKELTLEVLNGHAKNSRIVFSIITMEGKKTIRVDCDLKLSLKTAILYPIAKREYKPMVTGICKKMILTVNEMVKN